MPAVAEGDVERVRKALLEISQSLVPSPSTERTAKKSRIDLLSDQVKCSLAPSMDSVDVDMPSEGSAKKDSVAQDPVSKQEPASEQEPAPEQELASTTVGMGLSALYECTSHNCNILHVCCQGLSPKQRKEAKYTSKKTFHPFRGKWVAMAS